MRILLASSEVHPYSKTGGLGDMVGALGRALGRLGHKVGVVTPLYRGIRERFPQLARFDWRMDLPLGAERVSAQVWTVQTPENVTVYFVDVPRFFDRNGIYQEGTWEYVDNAQRFIFFSKAIAHLARYLPWQPQVVHLHDWQTGFVPLLIRHQQLAEGWRPAPATCFTIHNLAYQGRYSRATYALTNLPWDYFTPAGVEFYGGLNCLKAGLVYADVLTTVSPRYAREITTPEYGELLDGVLRERQQAGRLVGILNGVDYEEWRTVGNPWLKFPYTADNLAGKAANKLELQQEMGLPVAGAVPLFATISRLVEQKGIDILLGALEEMLATRMQFVLLGSGAPHYEWACRRLAARFPSQVAVHIGFDTPLAHRIEAGADFFLMPSRFEPSGLNQMYSLRYGTVPVVRRTGGLDDSVTDITDNPRRPTGIKFDEYSVRALARAIRKALVLYEHPPLLAHYRRCGMAADFSWRRTAERYLQIHQSLLDQPR